MVQASRLSLISLSRTQARLRVPICATTLLEPHREIFETGAMPVLRCREGHLLHVSLLEFGIFVQRDVTGFPPQLPKLSVVRL